MAQWAHIPSHRLGGIGRCIVTAATYERKHLFTSPEHLSELQDLLVLLAGKYGWSLDAWCIFPNHYHFVGSSDDRSTLPAFMKHLHSKSAIDLNKHDGTAGRRVWFDYWDTLITSEKSYLARLAYVHQNAVRHGVVRVARDYPYCSAASFEKKATGAEIATVYGFPIDRVSVPDDF